MAKKEVYTVDRLQSNPNQYVVSKYDTTTLSFNGAYEVDRVRGFHCNCLAGQQHKPTCRHREMVEIFTDAQRLSVGALYHYDTKKWDFRVIELPGAEDA